MSRTQPCSGKGSLRTFKRHTAEPTRQRARPAVDETVRQSAGEMAKNRLEQRMERLAAAAAHPLAELLACPQEVAQLLDADSRCLEVESGGTVFRQNEPCQGLYVVVAGEFVRKAERLETRVTLGAARPGDLLELAAVLGDGGHSYNLTAVTQGAVLMLPIDALRQAFEGHPPLRMRLLEELAREVSRAYITCCMTRAISAHRRTGDAARA